MFWGPHNSARHNILIPSLPRGPVDVSGAPGPAMSKSASELGFVGLNNLNSFCPLQKYFLQKNELFDRKTPFLAGKA